MGNMGYLTMLLQLEVYTLSNKVGK